MEDEDTEIDPESYYMSAPKEWKRSLMILLARFSAEGPAAWYGGKLGRNYTLYNGSPQLQRQPRRLPKPEVSTPQMQKLATNKQPVGRILHNIFSLHGTR